MWITFTRMWNVLTVEIDTGFGLFISVLQQQHQFNEWSWRLENHSGLFRWNERHESKLNSHKIVINSMSMSMSKLFQDLKQCSEQIQTSFYYCMMVIMLTDTNHRMENSTKIYEWINLSKQWKTSPALT